ncbi:autotransporter-associated beta strand repeat-containing protein [Variovorax sp. GT1P44]|uniref:autotransporter-associated beta strand repeat-containing protein n=1 Tax=Variovorax sp. GT1P44 TaxID=3443742 RepID=UPI003F4823D0
MNRVFRAIWNARTGQVVVVSERTKTAGKGTAGGICSVSSGFRFALRALAIGLAIHASASAQVSIPAGTNIGAYLNTNLSAANNNFILAGNSTWNTVVSQSAPHAQLTLDGAGNTITIGAIAGPILAPVTNVTPTTATISNATFLGTAADTWPVFYHDVAGVTSNLNLNDVRFSGFTGGSGGEGSVMRVINGPTVNITAGGTNGITFSNNTGLGDAGGVIGMYAGTLNFNGKVTFDSNATDNYGGAISMYQAAGVLNFNGPVSFLNNHANLYYGGAIDLWGGASTLTFNGPTTFSGNYVNSTTANTRGGAINVGDLSPGTGASIVQFNNSVTFDGNYVTSSALNGNARGGALNAFGSGASYDYRFTFTAPAIFTNNYAIKTGGGAGGGGYGGAIFYDSSAASVSLTSGSQFLNNSASTSGGAIYLQAGTISLDAATDNILFQGNRQGVSVSGGLPVAGTGTPNAIYVGSSGNLNLNANAGQQIRFFDPISSIAGSTVTVTKTGDGEVVFHGDNGATTQFDSTIQANTTVQGGLFTLADGVNYGNTAGGAFLVNTGSGTAGTVQGGANSSLRALTLTVANGGTVNVTGGTFTLDAPTINFQSGARFTGNGILAASGNINLTGSVIADTGAGDLNLTGRLTGTGGLTVQGGGVLELSNATNANTGNTSVAAGATLVGTVANAYATNTSVTVDGTLDLARNNLGQTVGNLSGSGSILLGSAVLTDVSTAASTYAGTITGSGSVIKSGTGNLTLSNPANTYTGGTAILAGGGTLTATNGSALGSGAVANNGALQLDFATDSTFANALTGAGALQNAGAGVATLTAPNSTAGAVSVTGGTLDFEQNGVFAASSLSTGAGATTSVGGNSQLTLTGALTQAAGSALNVDIGAATSITAASASLSGALNVTGFSGNAPALASALPTTFYTVIRTTGSGITGDFTSFASSPVANPVDYLSLRGQPNGANYDVGFGLTWLAGTTLGNGVFTLANPVDTFNVDLALVDQAPSGTGWDGTTLTKNGAGTLLLTADNTYTGVTTISAGTLQLGSGGTSGSITGSVVDNGALAFNRSDAVAFAGTISGSGAVHQIGAGTTTLTADNIYTGGTTITAGTLQLGGGGTTGSIVGNVADDGILAFNRSDATAFAGAISGSGAVHQVGAGTTTLMADNTYTGGTTITAGTLQLGSGGTTGAITGNVVDNGTLTFNRSDAVAFAGAISGSGAVHQAGTGTTVFTGNSSTFTGTTSVTNGTLQVNGTLGSAASALSVAAGGRLGGNGTIGGNVSIADGILAPGSSPGTLTIGGDLALAGASTLNYEFGQAGAPGGALNDLTVVGGNLTLDGTLNVTTSSGGTFGPGLYRVISYGGTLTDNGLVLGTTPPGSSTFVNTALAGQVNLVNTAGLTLNYWDGASGGFNGRIDGGSGTWQASSAGNLNWTEATGAINAPYADGTFAIFAGTPGTVTVDNSLGAVHASGMQFATGGYVVQGDPITLAAGSNILRVGDGTGAGAGYVATIGSVLGGTGGVDKTDLGTLVLTAANTYSGGTTISAGTLQLGDGVATGSIVGDVVDNGTLAFNNPGVTNFAGAISGSGAVHQMGGTTVLTADSTYGGGTTISAGTLQLGSGGTTGSITGNVLDNGTLVVDRSDSVALAGVISGSGAVHQAGAGTTTLTADNTYTGGTTISAGALLLGNGGTAGSIRGNVVDDGALGFNRSDAVGFGGVISGSGAVVQLGTGTTTLTADNTYTGGTTISGGTLQLGSGGTTGSIVGNVLDNGTLVFDRSDAVTFAGAISGAGAVTQVGGGATTLTAANTYTGGTTISSGVLQLGAGGTTGSIVGNVVDNGALAFGRSDAVTFAGVISGTGSVQQVGGGTTTLTANNTYAGGTVIWSGALELGSGGTTGSIVGNVVDNGTLIFNRSDAVTFAGDISGAGAVRHIGAGTSLLTGNSGTFSGATSVTGGTLRVDGTLGSSASTLSVATGGTIAGRGTFGGSVSIADGILAPGQSIGTLTIGGNLSLASPSILHYDFGQAGVVGGAFNDLTVVSGNLLLDGTVNVTAPTGVRFDPGLYRIISYGGTLTDNGLALGAVPGGTSLYVQTALAGQVNLVNTAGLTINVWDGAGPKFDGGVKGGSGIWQASAGNDNWADISGAVNSSYTDGSFAIFAGTPGTVTVDNSAGAVTSSGMQFATNGYAIEGAPVTLVPGSHVFRVGDGTEAGAGYVATIGAALNGSGGLDKTDLGTLVLTGANGYTGGTTISAGTLQLGNAGTSGSIVGDVTNNGTLAFNRSDSFELNGGISGTGAVRQVGAGTTVLSGTNTYTGGTTISHGTLQLGNGGPTGSIVGDVLNNGALAFNRSNDFTFPGVISGTGAVIQAGGGTTTLSAANNYAGGTTISAGTLAGSATSFGTGAILDNAALIIDQPGNASFANALNGTGSFTKSGAGALDVTGTNALSGATTVAAGLLAVNGSLANSAVQVLDGATLGGNGMVGATAIRAGGTIAPGNSVGTLSINGNYTQAAGSIYQAQVVPNSTASDRIQVSGSATLESGAVLNVTKVTPGAYSLNSRYTVLTAGNGVTGRYTLGGDTSGTFFRLVDSYDANNVYLMPEQVRNFVSAAQTHNEIATARSLNDLPDGNRLKDAVGLLETDVQARDAFNQLSGEIHASAKTQMIEASHFVRDASTDRVRQALCAVGGADPRISAKAIGKESTLAAMECNPDRPVAWARSFGSWGSTDADGNAAKLDRSIGGLLGGADLRVADTWRVGMMAGYSRSSFNAHDRNASGSSDDYDIGVYGGTQWGDLGLRLGAAYTWHAIDTSRAVSFPGYTDRLGGKYNAGTTQVFGELGQRIDAGTIQYEPFANLAYVRQSTDGFLEQGTVGAVNGRSDATSATFSTLGLRAASTFEVGGTDWTARGMLGWRHAYGGTVPTSLLSFDGSSAFSVAGVPIARNTAVLELGVEAPIARNAVFSMSYAGQAGSGMRDNGVRATLNWKF